MNKNELITKVAEKSELSKKDAEKAVNSIIQTITETLASGEKVQLVGFGTFESRNRPARKGHNPSTGEEIQIKAANIASFKAGKGLKDALN